MTTPKFATEIQIEPIVYIEFHYIKLSITVKSKNAFRKIVPQT